MSRSLQPLTNGTTIYQRWSNTGMLSEIYTYAFWLKKTYLIFNPIRHMNFYIQDSSERHVIVTHTDIGNLTGVKVKFIRGDGVKATGSQHEVVVRYVTVESTENTAGYEMENEI